MGVHSRAMALPPAIALSQWLMAVPWQRRGSFHGARHGTGHRKRHATAMILHKGARSWIAVVVLPLHFLLQLRCIVSNVGHHVTASILTTVDFPCHPM